MRKKILTIIFVLAMLLTACDKTMSESDYIVESTFVETDYLLAKTNITSVNIINIS